MSKKDKKPEDEGDELDPEIEKMLETFSEQDREIIKQMIDDLPEELKDAIAEGRGKIHLAKMDGTGGPMQMGLGLINQAITEAMTEATMRGEDPFNAALRRGATELATTFVIIASSFPMQADAILKSMIYGMAAYRNMTPKDLCEDLAESAPDTMSVLNLGALPPDDETTDQVKELNDLFNLEAAPEPTLDGKNDDDNTDKKEKK